MKSLASAGLILSLGVVCGLSACDDSDFVDIAVAKAGTGNAAGGQGNRAGAGGSSAGAGAAGDSNGGALAGSSGDEAGAGGDAGASGSSGAAGEENGTAGSSTAGTAGVAGRAGAGGGAGASGGPGAGAGGGAGSGGTSGSAGTGGGAGRAGAGGAAGNGGSSGSGGASQCTLKADCIPYASQWIGVLGKSCTSDANCTTGQKTVCIDVGGVGACAIPVPTGGCNPDPSFPGPYPDEDTRPRFGASGTVQVCADKSQLCTAGKCVLDPFS